MSERLLSGDQEGREIITSVDHPRFGRMVEFVDSDGLGMQVGEGEDSFIVRPSRPGHVVVEGANTDAAMQKARQLMGYVVDRRGGHR